MSTYTTQNIFRTKAKVLESTEKITLLVKKNVRVNLFNYVYQLLLNKYKIYFFNDIYLIKRALQILLKKYFSYF